MRANQDSVDRLAAEIGFSGVVRVDDADGVRLARAYGLAHRACQVANTMDTQFGIASGSKGLTALTVVSLIEEHQIVREVEVGVLIEVIAIGVHELATTEQFLRVLDGHAAKFAAGDRFCYSNGGYVVLALIAERASGTPFHDLVRQRVCAPAGMVDSEYLRSDELPGRAAIGYLGMDGPRTNVFHLPVRGSGDGGIYTTAADIHSLWSALFAGRIVSSDWVTAMVRPRSDVPNQSMRYGLGLWLHGSGEAVMLHGSDSGASFRSVHHPLERVTRTVISNTTRGAWTMTRHLDEILSG